MSQERKKWVLTLAGFRYYIGRFEEGRFIIEQNVFSADYASGCQAAQTYANMPDGRTVWIAWMRDGSRAPTSPWRCCMTVPKELALRRMADGTIRLIQRPIPELECLREPFFSLQDTPVENSYYTSPERIKLRGFCYSAPFVPGDTLRFRVLCDRSTVEVFIPNTDVEFSFCVYPAQDADGLSLICDGDCTVDKLNIYTMKTTRR